MIRPGTRRAGPGGSLLARVLAVPALAVLALPVLAALVTANPAFAVSPPARGAAGLPVFRVDVSRYPLVGLVVTVPGAARVLSAADFSVSASGMRAGGVKVAPTRSAALRSVKLLSPDDVELAVAPATGLPAEDFTAEVGATARFLAGLPYGERSVAVNPAMPGLLPGPLSADPAPAVEAAATVRRGGRTRSDADTLETALTVFSAGPHVRRTVVLALATDQPLPAALRAWFFSRLAESGTALYVLDAAPGGDPRYDTLAEGSGGLAIPVRGTSTAAWTSAFARVSADLSEQYYLRFTDRTPLPGRVRVTVRAPATVGNLPGAGSHPVELHGTAALPAANPVAAPLPFPGPLPALAVPPLPDPWWDLALGLSATALIITGVSYGVAMLAASRREPLRRPKHRRRRAVDGLSGSNELHDGSLPAGRPSAVKPATRQPLLSLHPVSQPPVNQQSLTAGEPFFVFLMPCLNEEAVIANSLRRLLSMPGGDFVVLVVDDGSDDATAEVVAAEASDRVWLLRRKQPHAREGKGEALNAAVRYLLSSGHLDGRDPNRVIVVIVDADGQMDPESMRVVAPLFADPSVGAVQIGVRINNRGASRLARMQDMEFVIYTEVFQRGRRHLGSVGLGGNGQFMRLSALLSVGNGPGNGPWSRALTDDLDLGVRMIAAGWRNEYCPAVAVHQQGVVRLRQLIRQRSRWFQGHLQSWRLIPLVLRKAPRRSRTDLLYHLTSPIVLLTASLLTASFVVSLGNAALEALRGQDPAGWWIASTYALSFGPAVAFSSVYWSRERREGVGVLRAAALAHLYVIYGMMWYPAGWWAVGRTLRGQTGWAKTARVAESPTTVAPRSAAPAMGLTGVQLASDSTTGWAAVPPLSDVGSTDTGGNVVPGAGIPPGTASGGRPGRSRIGKPRIGKPRIRKPRIGGVTRRAMGVAAGVMAVAAAATAAAVGLLRPATPGGWETVFSGYGSVAMAGSASSRTVTLSPGVTTAPAISHSALVVSTTSYRDFAATLRVRTVRQLRTGAAGRPRPWEVGWVVWHYTSDHSFYALTLESSGWELSKQDTAYRGGERFLASGLAPSFRVGVPHAIGVVQLGDRITVSADGHILTHFTDTSNPYLGGAIGFYSEDAQATFDHIKIVQLSAEGQ